MSKQLVPVTEDVERVICDLCGEVIPKGTDEAEVGHLTGVRSGHERGGKVKKSTKHVMFSWPSFQFRNRIPYVEKNMPENRNRNYDFHAKCVLDAVEKAIAENKNLREGSA